MPRETEPVRRIAVYVFERDLETFAKHFKAYGSVSVAVRYAVRQVAEGLRENERELQEEQKECLTEPE